MFDVLRQSAGLCAAGLLACPALSLAVAVPGSWTPTYADEFNAGSTDLSGWAYETGNNNGWGNNEREVYTSSSKNVSVGGGDLHITAIASGTGNGQTYTSGRITTTDSFSQAYGLFEFRAKMPAGQGLWPAIWMMPKGSTYGDWPNSGEIDVLESQGQSPTLVQGSLHSGTAYDRQDTQTTTFADSGLMPSGFATTDWHTYDLEWDKGTGNKPATLKWFVDGTLYETQRGGWVTPSGAATPDAPFDKPFYLIMNLAVGGDYVGDPALAAGSYDMQVDYARAYTAAVPEPASLAAVGGTLVFLLRRRSRP